MNMAASSSVDLLRNCDVWESMLPIWFEKASEYGKYKFLQLQVVNVVDIDVYHSAGCRFEST